MTSASIPNGTPRYRSTRGGQQGLTFEDAVFEGLAKDGGVLVPEWIPDVSDAYKHWVSLTFDQLAYEIVSRYCSESEVPACNLREILKTSYSKFEHPEIVPCPKVGDIHVMELFHGPSLSFKDFSLQALGNLYDFFLNRNPRRLTILAATLGDTGSATIHALSGKENIDCFVLFPEGRISSVQQLQMTSVLDPNLHCLSVQGTFYECQNMVKELMGDLEFKKKYGVGSVTSINWATILFQVTYYFYTYFKLFPKCDGSVSFSIPIGNSVDVLGAYYAKRMGLPIKNIIVATNSSKNSLHRFFSSGHYDKEEEQNWMSIEGGNFERFFFYLFEEDSGKLATAMAGFTATGTLHVPDEIRERAGLKFVSASASEKQIADTMKGYFEKYAYLLSPDTACGVVAVDKVRDQAASMDVASHMIAVLGADHPAKFQEEVVQATGKAPDLPPALARVKEAKTRFQVVPASARSVHNIIQRSLYYRGTYLHYADRPTPERCEDPRLKTPTPGMWIVCLDVEGTLVGEAWLELQKKTGLEELKRTTAHEPDYDKLMMYRIDALRRNGIKLQDMKDVVGTMEPLPGCREFLTWLKSIVPRVLLLTDTFEEYAMPLFDKLGYPCVFCNSLTVQEGGEITGHILRLRDQKRKAVESLQRLNFRVIAVGDSFNDISMMKAAERGILMNPAEKVVKLHGEEFPMCWDYQTLKDRITDIVMKPPVVPTKPLVVPVPLDFESEYRRMWLVLANVAGTFAPDPWPALAAMTGIEELKTTSAHVPDFDDLMNFRVKILRQHKLQLQDVTDKVKHMEPLPGAKDFLAWLKPVVPRCFMISDSFEEFAMPILQKLEHPMVFCNFLEADDEGYLARHVVRLRDQKRLACEEYQRLNFRVIAVGGSYLDVPMLKAAEHGIFFKPSEGMMSAHPEIPCAKNYEELKRRILDIVEGGSKKRKLSTMSTD